MRNKIIALLAALFCFAIGYAGNIQVDNISMKPGETKDLKISLASSVSNKVGVQFDVTLPEGFSLESKSGTIYQLSPNQANDMNCNVSELGGNGYRFLLYSNSLQKLKAGELISLNLKVSDSKALGNYTVSVSNVMFSDLDGVVTKESGVTSTVKVTDFFTLIYLLDGVEYKKYVLEYGVSITPEAEPSKEGYTFSGWSTIPQTMPAHDVTVTGTFTVNKYMLTYMVDGKVYKSYELEYGTSITPEAEPTKEGYTFSGWSWIPSKMPAEDVTVTGSFTINQYTLTYVVDGKMYKSYELEYGSTITPEAEPTKEGYNFSGWSEIPATMPAHDVTVTGSFSKGQYQVTYMVDGQVYKTISYDYNDMITPEPEPKREGYTFSGWSEIPATMPAHGVTVTGTVTINKYTLTYMVDGEVYKSYELEYGTSITPEAEPTKEGYAFSGWSWIPSKMPAEDVIVTGSFTINQYTLTYMVDGEVYKSVEVEYDTEIVPVDEPTKEGYTFSGWSWIPSKMPAEDVTVTGTFTVNSYKLTYMIDDKVYKEVMYEYGATITPEPQPEGDYQTFEWVNLPQTMPAHDVMVYASYTTDIAKTLTSPQRNARIYSLDGKAQDTLQKGLNIVRMGDGTTKKVVVK